jgi:hypothetical protein
VRPRFKRFKLPGRSLCLRGRTISASTTLVSTSATRLNRFHAAHVRLNSELLLAELKLLERQVNWDRLVCVLRGKNYFMDREFDFDSDTVEQPYDIWYDVIHQRPM